MCCLLLVTFNKIIQEGKIQTRANQSVRRDIKKKFYANTSLSPGLQSKLKCSYFEALQSGKSESQM